METGSVVSADGTEISYRRFGQGPAVVLVHGSMLAAQDLTELAEALAGDCTAYVPDRRGRGRSGPHGPRFGIDREVEDLQALLKGTGASRVFGLSSGALIALRTALRTPAVERIALYEPPLSVDGSVPVGWAPRYHREIAAGRTVSALVTALKGLRVDPVFAKVPRFALVPLLKLALRLQRPKGDDVPLAELVPTMAADLMLVAELADTTNDYAAVEAGVLLLAGGRSPAYFRPALDALTGALPRSSRQTFDKLDHSGPTNDGGPAQVARTLREFFA
ncbi:alpha/beta fold hydrolase [Kribbella solani]|uniref:alpha/beta fold hydrolase n=1 Tax=Kribbella solani TaxID=236067 RepID=UPI0029A2F26A|nr:alpha/beta hydrolase [Kribbella solani]MDX2970790.1 alpha/beta hydrolase [Kribbella solani]